MQQHPGRPVMGARASQNAAVSPSPATGMAEVEAPGQSPPEGEVEDCVEEEHPLEMDEEVEEPASADPASADPALLMQLAAEAFEVPKPMPKKKRGKKCGHKKEKKRLQAKRARMVGKERKKEPKDKKKAKKAKKAKKDKKDKKAKKAKKHGRKRRSSSSSSSSTSSSSSSNDSSSSSEEPMNASRLRRTLRRSIEASQQALLKANQTLVPKAPPAWLLRATVQRPVLPATQNQQAEIPKKAAPALPPAALAQLQRTHEPQKIDIEGPSKKKAKYSAEEWDAWEKEQKEMKERKRKEQEKMQEQQKMKEKGWKEKEKEEGKGKEPTENDRDYCWSCKQYTWKGKYCSNKACKKHGWGCKTKEEVEKERERAAAWKENFAIQRDRIMEKHQQMLDKEKMEMKTDKEKEKDKDEKKEMGKDDALMRQPTTPPELRATGQTPSGAASDGVDRASLMEAVIATLGSLSAGSSSGPAVSAEDYNKAISRQRELEAIVRHQNIILLDWHQKITAAFAPLPPRAPATPPGRDQSISPWRDPKFKEMTLQAYHQKVINDQMQQEAARKDEEAKKKDDDKEKEDKPEGNEDEEGKAKDDQGLQEQMNEAQGVKDSQMKDEGNDKSKEAEDKKDEEDIRQADEMKDDKPEVQADEEKKNKEDQEEKEHQSGDKDQAEKDDEDKDEKDERARAGGVNPSETS